MKKDFSENILKSMSLEKKFKALYDLASFIELEKEDIDSTHFAKLQKYHDFLKDDSEELIQKINKEFQKVKALDYQYQVYIMNLERFLGKSKKDYDFMVELGDKVSKNENAFPLVCLLDSVRSAHNVGSFFRNAECFNIEKLILTGITPKKDHEQVIKTAMGCTETISSEYYQNANEAILKYKNNGYEIWAIETGKNAIHLSELTKPSKPIVLMFGHEQHGLSHDLLKEADKIVDIELFGQKNSLNVSISQGIVLYQITSLLKN